MNTIKEQKIPIFIKIGFTLFMAVLVPFYWNAYGPSNFLYFCDVALFLTLLALWTESKFIASLPAVGIIVPQMLWVIDFAFGFFGSHPIGLTAYMFDENIPLFARSLSLFHGWLPFLLVYMMFKLGYDRRAVWAWTSIAWCLMAICYYFMPEPGAVLSNANAPVNINYVFGFSVKAPQEIFTANTYFALMLCALPLLIYIPSHKILKRLFKQEMAYSI